MRIIITDLTEMHAGNFCVAGWDIDSARMVRLLPNGANWTNAMLQLHSIKPRSLFYFQPTGHIPNGALPHRTEDTYVLPNGIVELPAIAVNWLGGQSPLALNSVAASFENNIVVGAPWNGRSKIHVPENTNTRSLCGLITSANNLSFHMDGAKLRAYIRQGHHIYDVAVASHELRLIGVNMNDTLPQNQNVHIRLGLARAWAGQPSKCFVMVNGVYW